MLNLRETLGASLERLRFLVFNPSQLWQYAQWRKYRNQQPLQARMPWLCFPAIAHLGKVFSEGTRVFEYGGGGSTLWFEDRNARVDTVEHDLVWAKALKDKVGSNVEIHHRPPEDVGELASAVSPGYFDAYVSSIHSLTAGDPPDVVLVDGRCRVECVKAASVRVRPGGLVVLDDSQRPRYAPAFELLANWPQLNFVGLKPGDENVSQVTMWTRPTL